MRRELDRAARIGALSQAKLAELNYALHTDVERGVIALQATVPEESQTLYATFLKSQGLTSSGTRVYPDGGLQIAGVDDVTKALTIGLLNGNDIEGCRQALVAIRETHGFEGQVDLDVPAAE